MSVQQKTIIHTDQSAWHQRLREWADSGKVQLGLAVLFAGLGALAATQYLRAIPLTEEFGKVALWQKGGPIVTACLTAMAGAASIPFLIVLRKGNPKIKAAAAERPDLRNYHQIMRTAFTALFAFSVTYVLFIAIGTKEDDIVFDNLRRYFSTLNDDALTAGTALGIGLTTVAAGGLVISGGRHLYKTRPTRTVS